MPTGQPGARRDAGAPGPNVWHDTPAAAMAVLEELEETARLWLLCQPRPTPLTEPQIEQLRQTFGAQW